MMDFENFFFFTFDLVCRVLDGNHWIEGCHFGLLHISYFIWVFYLFLQNIFNFQGKDGENLPTLRQDLKFVIHLSGTTQAPTVFWELKEIL